MYGCTTVSVFVVTVLFLSTGLTVAFPKAPSSLRNFTESSFRNFTESSFRNCTGANLSISVNCLPEHHREVFPLTAINRSSCCSFSEFNSSHPSEACSSNAEGQQGAMSTNAKIRESRSTFDCLLRIAAARSDSNSYRIRTCEGSNVRLLCEVNVSCSDVVRWRSFNGTVIVRKLLVISNVQRGDAGNYTCEVTDNRGKVKQTGIVRVDVQFAPVILVPNISLSVWAVKANTIECESEASPRPAMTWYRDGILLSPEPSLYAISEEFKGCRTTSYVLFKDINASLPFDPEDFALENLTCVAENELGKSVVTFLKEALVEDTSEPSEGPARRPFNVTGFIVGMLPPLLISFYIIIKLGYRSRHTPTGDGTMGPDGIEY